MQVAGITSNKQQNPNFGMLKVDLDYANKTARKGFAELKQLGFLPTAIGVENGKTVGIVRTIQGTQMERNINHGFLDGKGASINRDEANKLISNVKGAKFLATA